MNDNDIAEVNGTDADDQIDLTGDAYIRWAAKTAPDLTRLPPAVRDEDGLRIMYAEVGDVVIYNVFSSVLPGRPHLRTVKGRILRVDPQNGIAWLLDMDRQHQACFNWLHRPKNVNEEIRIPAGALKERYDELMNKAAAAIDDNDIDSAIRFRNEANRVMGRIRVVEDEATGKRKVGRPRKIRTEEEIQAERDRVERRAKGEMKRGRPKGSKNRSRDVILAEKSRERQERLKRAS